jgi:hypothetical protein
VTSWRDDPLLREWHTWYAWYPVSVGEGDSRWLEHVERRYGSGFQEIHLPSGSRLEEGWLFRPLGGRTREQAALLRRRRLKALLGAALLGLLAFAVAFGAIIEGSSRL